MLGENFASNFELGLVFISCAAVATFGLLACVCFKRSKGIIEEGSKSGIFGVLVRKENGAGDTDAVCDENLGGARATSHRRLPDIPDAPVDCEVAATASIRSSQDTNSELYALVEIGQQADAFHSGAVLENSIPALQNGEGEDAEAQLHNYDQVKNSHGYSKIKKKGENPYAKVRRSDTLESETAEPDETETDTDNYNIVYNVALTEDAKTNDCPAVVISTSATIPEPPAALLSPPLPLPQRGSRSSLASGDSNHIPHPPPRGRRVHSVLVAQALTAASINRPISLLLSSRQISPVDDTDGTPSGERLPEAVLHQQVHFSGDSQASQDSKGYSSISVREPLANLKAAQNVSSSGRSRTASRGADSLEPHYATVSDAEDSDEMYAAIAEPPAPPIYNSNGAGGGGGGGGGGGACGSDTYAKINDLSSAVNAPIADNCVPESAAGTATSPVGVHDPEWISSSPIPPTPPSVVSLRQLSVGSSRLHASTLSIASQTSVLGSPKPEKRQANSPLPPPPAHDPLATEAAGSVDRNSNRKSANIDEMYAKVMKKKGFSLAKTEQQQQQSAVKMLQHRGSVDLGFLVNRDDDLLGYYDSSRRNSVDSAPQRSDGSDAWPGNETLLQEAAVAIVVEDEDEDDLNYEVLPRVDRKISDSDPGYEKIQLKSGDSFNDPCYERIHLNSESEPNYEIVGYQRTARISESDEPGYEQVQAESRSFDRQDPNYESLHYSVHDPIDPPYAKVDDGGPQSLADEQLFLHDQESANNNIAMPLYAQVVKPKRLASPGACVIVTNPAHEGNMTQMTIVHEEDHSVGSSKNTTIIRITDGRPAFRFYSGDDTFGVPEQV